MENVLWAARGLAMQSNKTIWAVIFELAGKGLRVDPSNSVADQRGPLFGFHPHPMRGEQVTNELIDHLRVSGPF